MIEEEIKIIKRPDRIKNRTGEINFNKNGSVMEIIEYIDSKNIIVEFEDGYTIKNNYANFKKGLIKNPYDKTIYGIGYLGIENYSELQDISYNYSYKIWKDMLYRCCNSNKQHITYNECNVCTEWESYKNFVKWYDKNYYEVPYEKTHLDKDILCLGNKIYSPKTCVFVPQTISQVFQTHDRQNKKLPMGVFPYGKYKYVASIHNNILKKRIYSDIYTDITKTKNKYLEMKKNYFYQLAEYYKQYIPTILYETLIKYSNEWENIYE